MGVRRLRVEGQPFNENGVAMAKVTYMEWAPEVGRCRLVLSNQS